MQRFVNRAIVAELVERKTPQVLHSLPDKGKGWTVHYALFGRSDYTDAVRAEAAAVRARLLNLEQIERDLTREAWTRTT